MYSIRLQLTNRRLTVNTNPKAKLTSEPRMSLSESFLLKLRALRLTNQKAIPKPLFLMTAQQNSIFITQGTNTRQNSFTPKKEQKKNSFILRKQSFLPSCPNMKDMMFPGTMKFRKKCPIPIYHSDLSKLPDCTM